MSKNRITVPHRVQTIWRDGGAQEAEEELLCEYWLDIYVDKKHQVKCACTPSDLENLITGRLFTDGLIEAASDIKSCEIRCEEHCADMILNDVLLKKSCACSQRQKTGPFLWDAEWIFRLADVFAKDTVLHQKTSCTHSCFLAQQDRILYMAEDISRHNAVDKVIGWALREHVMLEESILYTSGRIPADMMLKVVRAGIPVVVSNAAPTERGVSLAEEYQISLIGGVKKNRLKIYTDFRK